MGLLGKLEDRIERIHSASEAAAQRQKDQDLQIEEAKNQLKSNVDFRNSVCQNSMQIEHCHVMHGPDARQHRVVSWCSAVAGLHLQDAVAMDDAVSSLEYIDEDRAGGRPKRRR